MYIYFRAQHCQKKELYSVFFQMRAIAYIIRIPRSCWEKSDMWGTDQVHLRSHNNHLDTRVRCSWLEGISFNNEQNCSYAGENTIALRLKNSHTRKLISISTVTLVFMKTKGRFIFRPRNKAQTTEKLGLYFKIYWLKNALREREVRERSTWAFLKSFVLSWYSALVD